MHESPGIAKKRMVFVRKKETRQKNDWGSGIRRGIEITGPGKRKMRSLWGQTTTTQGHQRGGKIRGGSRHLSGKA